MSSLIKTRVWSNKNSEGEGQTVLSGCLQEANKKWPTLLLRTVKIMSDFVGKYTLILDYCHFLKFHPKHAEKSFLFFIFHLWLYGPFSPDLSTLVRAILTSIEDIWYILVLQFRIYLIALRKWIIATFNFWRKDNFWTMLRVIFSYTLCFFMRRVTKYPYHIPSKCWNIDSLFRFWLYLTVST